MSSDMILRALDRAHSGPVVSVKKWDVEWVPGKISDILERFRLGGTCNPQEPINDNDELADRFFQAAFELALELGILCIDTERVIRFSRDELERAIGEAPSSLLLGEGLDRVELVARRPEDGRKPVFAAPLGIVVSEELWVPIMQSIARERTVDVFQGGSLATVFGRQIRSGTPYETLAGRLNAQLNREALWRAGRPGMCTTAVISSVTAYGQLGGYGIVGGFKPSDLALILSPAELKTSFSALHKAAHAVNCGGLMLAGTASMIGGYAGPPEGAALSAMAFTLLQYALFGNHCGGAGIMDIRYQGNSGRHAMWSLSVQLQGVSRNTDLLVNTVFNQVAGPDTEMLLYESVALALNLGVSGTSLCIGPRSAGGKFANHLSPLECRLSGATLKAGAGMSRADVNRVVQTLLPRYEENLLNPPKGKPFDRCYDLKTLQPSAAWSDSYRRIFEEIADLGVPL
jgi:methylamine--corrinoid protein Co-methyltransferase